MGDWDTAPPVREAPTQQQVSTSDSAGSTGRTAVTRRGRYVLHSNPAAAPFAIITHYVKFARHVDFLCGQHFFWIYLDNPEVGGWVGEWVGGSYSN